MSERRRRILYLEGEPRWEFKFLRRALAGDDVLELVSWLRTTDRKTYRQGVGSETELADGFPADRAGLYGYDVVVLGSLAASALNEEQHGWLESFVSERGGSLLVLAGRDALDDGRWDVQPLAAALPIYLERSATPTYLSTSGQARPTTLGRRSPFTQLIDAEGGDGWATLPRARRPAATGRSETRRVHLAGAGGQRYRAPRFWSPNPTASATRPSSPPPAPGAGRCAHRPRTCAIRFSGGNCCVSSPKRRSVSDRSIWRWTGKVSPSAPGFETRNSNPPQNVTATATVTHSDRSTSSAHPGARQRAGIAGCALCAGRFGRVPGGRGRG